MKRRLAQFCVVLAALIFNVAHAHAAREPVYLVDRSTLVHQENLLASLPAFQAAADQFARYWERDAQLIVSNDPPAGAWRIVVDDRSDNEGVLGYHGIGRAPYAMVYARTAIEAGDTWQGTLTHELFEMLADPYIDRLALGSKLWLVEVCDPVEADRYNYALGATDGSLVPISDFVLPSWFRKHGKPPFDFARHVRRPEQILHGGYVSYWENGMWNQLFRW